MHIKKTKFIKCFKYIFSTEKVLPEYTENRTPDGQAVADLSEQNYLEVILVFLYVERLNKINYK